MPRFTVSYCNQEANHTLGGSLKQPPGPPPNAWAAALPQGDVIVIKQTTFALFNRKLETKSPSPVRVPLGVARELRSIVPSSILLFNAAIVQRYKSRLLGLVSSVLFLLLPLKLLFVSIVK